MKWQNKYNVCIVYIFYLHNVYDSISLNTSIDAQAMAPERKSIETLNWFSWAQRTLLMIIIIDVSALHTFLLCLHTRHFFLFVIIFSIVVIIAKSGNTSKTCTAMHSILMKLLPYSVHWWGLIQSFVIYFVSSFHNIYWGTLLQI